MNKTLILAAILILSGSLRQANSEFVLKERFGEADDTYAACMFDIDNDSDLDYITNYYSQTHKEYRYRIFKNDGLGHLAPFATINKDNYFYSSSNGITAKNEISKLSSTLISISMGSGDIDNDGDIDFISSKEGLTEIYKNDGQGRFTLFESTGGQGKVFVGDLDKDGDQDLISLCNVYKNDGIGNFSYFENISSLTARAIYSAVGDVDNDGCPDFMCASVIGTNKGVLKTYKNDGIGHFIYLSSASIFGTIPINIYDGEVLTADIDKDGDSDCIVRLAFDNNSLRGPFYHEGFVFKNDGTGNFVLFSSLSAVSGSTEINDIDRDGDMDLIVVNWYVWIYANDGTGIFALSKQIDVSRAMIVSAVDIDKDGDIDLVLGGFGYKNEVYEQINNFTPKIGLINFRVYPNPTTSNAYFSFKYEKPYNSGKIQIFNILGEKIKELSVGPWLGYDGNIITTWDITNRDNQKAASGIYLYWLSLETDEGSIVSKINKLGVTR